MLNTPIGIDDPNDLAQLRKLRVSAPIMAPTVDGDAQPQVAVAANRPTPIVPAGAPVQAASTPIIPTGANQPASASATLTRSTPIGDPNFSADQARYDYLKRAGSGLDQLTHPVDAEGNPTGKKVGLGHKIAAVLGRIGDVAGSALVPSVAAMIPGTTFHHDMLVNQAANRVGGDLREQAEEDENAQREAQTKNLEDQGAKELSPEQQAFNYYTSTGLNPADAYGRILETKSGGKPYSPEMQAYGAMLKLGMDPLEAFQKIEQAKTNPDTAAADKKAYENLLQKKLLRQPLTPQEKAQMASYEQATTLGQHTTFNLNQGKTSDTRLDRSYDAQTRRIDEARKPMETQGQKLAEAMDLINQGNAQGDALLAPLILSATAGGPGSGVRMNEAEISRIIGGRTAWESLKANLNKWSLDPQDAQIPPEQRQAMRGIAQAVLAKITAKRQVIEEAEDGLLAANDVGEHRRIVAEMHRKLDAIDSGQHYIGEKITIKGQSKTITAVHSDGSFDAN